MSAKKKKEGNNAGIQQENVLEAVVIADSFNSRFYPVTAKRPRCLFPLANQPLLSYTLEFLSSCGVKHVYVYCNHCAEQIKHYLSNSKWTKPSSPCTVTPIMSCDFTSVGDVLRDVDQKSLFESDFLLVPGDVISNVQLKGALEEHKNRREKDKNMPLMTLVLRASSPTHRSRSVEDDIVIASNKTTNRVLHYFRLAEDQRKIQFPLSIFQSENKVEIRYDLTDTGIWVCSPQVPQLFTDNFDYQSQFDFIRGILINEEFLGNQIHMHVAKSQYCSRVQNFHMYDVVSRDVISRWTYPFVPEIVFDETLSGNPVNRVDENYCLLRHNVYLHTTCFLGHNSVVQDNTVIGKGTIVGSHCKITNTVIGNDCHIEDDCIISGSYIWNSVTIKKGSKISNSFVCDDVTIHEDVVLTDSCVLCDQVAIGPSIKLEEATVVHLFGKEDEEATTNKPFNLDDVGERGKGYIWQLNEGSDAGSDASLAKGLWGLSLQEHDKLMEKNYENEDESETDGSSIMSEEEEYDEQEPVEIDDDFAIFQREIRESLHGGYEDKVQCDNLILEINSSKYAYNMSVKDIIQTVTKSLFDLATITDAGNSQYFANLKKVLTYFIPLLCKYNKNATSQLDCIYAIEEYAVSHEHVANCLVKVLMFLYENDVLSEEVILHWNSKPRTFAGVFTPEQIREKVNKFIQWLHEAEEEDSDESD